MFEKVRFVDEKNITTLDFEAFDKIHPLGIAKV